MPWGRLAPPVSRHTDGEPATLHGQGLEHELLHQRREVSASDVLQEKLQHGVTAAGVTLLRSRHVFDPNGASLRRWKRVERLQYCRNRLTFPIRRNAAHRKPSGGR